MVEPVTKAVIRGAEEFLLKKWDGESASFVANVSSLTASSVLSGKKGTAGDIVKKIRDQLPEGTERALLHKQIDTHENLARSGAKGVTKRKRWYNHLKGVVDKLIFFLRRLGVGDIDNIRKEVRVRLGIEDEDGNEMDGNPTIADLDRLIANEDISKITGKDSKLSTHDHEFNKTLVRILGRSDIAAWRRTQHRGEEQEAQDGDSNAGRLQKNTTGNAKAAAKDEDLEPKEKQEEKEIDKYQVKIRNLVSEKQKFADRFEAIFKNTEKLANFESYANELGEDLESFSLAKQQYQKSIKNISSSHSQMENTVDSFSQKVEEIRCGALARMPELEVEVEDAVGELNHEVSEMAENEVENYYDKYKEDFQDEIAGSVANLHQTLGDKVEQLTLDCEGYSADTLEVRDNVESNHNDVNVMEDDINKIRQKLLHLKFLQARRHNPQFRRKMSSLSQEDATSIRRYGFSFVSLY